MKKHDDTGESTEEKLLKAATEFLQLASMALILGMTAFLVSWLCVLAIVTYYR